MIKKIASRSWALRSQELAPFSSSASNQIDFRIDSIRNQDQRTPQQFVTWEIWEFDWKVDLQLNLINESEIDESEINESEINESEINEPENQWIDESFGTNMAQKIDAFKTIASSFQGQAKLRGRSMSMRQILGQREETLTGNDNEKRKENGKNFPREISKTHHRELRSGISRGGRIQFLMLSRWNHLLSFNLSLIVGIIIASSCLVFGTLLHPIWLAGKARILRFANQYWIICNPREL